MELYELARRRLLARFSSNNQLYGDITEFKNKADNYIQSLWNETWKKAGRIKTEMDKDKEQLEKERIENEKRELE